MTGKLPNSGRFGIDLGTYNCRAACLDRLGAVQHVRLNGLTAVRSAVLLARPDAFVGPDALEIGIQRKGRPHELSYSQFRMGEAAVLLGVLRHAMQSGTQPGCPGDGEPVGLKPEVVVAVPYGIWADEAASGLVVCSVETAGLAVVDLVDGPSAVARAYCYHTQLQDDSFVALVFDLGGHALEVAVLQVFSGLGGGSEFGAEVLAYEAKDLGGEAWTGLIVDHLRLGRSAGGVSDWRLRELAEEAKVALSVEQVYSVPCAKAEELGIPEEDRLLHRRAVRGDERFALDLRSSEKLDLCRSLIKQVLDQARRSWSGIDRVLLAGGGCRMPMVADMLEHLSSQKAECATPDSSYEAAVVNGAAVLASCVDRRSRRMDTLAAGVAQLPRGAQWVGDLRVHYMGQVLAVSLAAAPVQSGEAAELDVLGGETQGPSREGSEAALDGGATGAQGYAGKPQVTEPPGYVDPQYSR